MYVFLKYYDCGLFVLIVFNVFDYNHYSYLYASSSVFVFLFPVFAVHFLNLSIPSVISNRIRELRFGIRQTS
jgi:hypothetical protein